MSPANILITGASGYLGGHVLAQWKEAGLPPHGTAYALVRSDKHASEVESLGFSPIKFDPYDSTSVDEAIVQHHISIVFWLVDALHSDAQLMFINALAKFKVKEGVDVHFVHTSGAKMVSSHAGAPDEPISDADPKMYDIQKSQKAQIPLLQKATDTNNIIIEKAEALGVRSYIFIPCIVYGQGRGLGNPVSIQTVAIVKAARALRKSWPVSHVTDTANLYLEILRSILKGDDIGHGKNGYYLASSGSAAWDDIYSAIAASLHRRGVIDSAEVTAANDQDLEKMGEALECPEELVPLQLSGNCTLEAAHGKAIGWHAKFGPEHILEAADGEVATVLQHV